MSSDYSKAVIAYVLGLLEKEDVSLSKIVLHKFIYFLNYLNVVNSHRFEAYTYGPFSFELASDIGKMAFWDEIEENQNSVEVIDIANYGEVLSNEEEVGIVDALNSFATIAQDDYSFTTMELIGTIFFCIESLEDDGEDVTKNSVEEAFVEWKNDKYPPSLINEYIERIDDVLDVLQ